MIKFKDKDDEFKKQILFSNCKLRGDSKTGLLCGCIYYACLKNGFCIISNVLADKANIKPKYVHIMMNGKIVKTGDYNLALEVEKNGYSKINNMSEIETYE